MSEKEIAGPKSKSSTPRSKGKENQSSAKEAPLEVQSPDIGLTPFQPDLAGHADLMSSAGSVDQRSAIATKLQQTYGNRYVQRLLTSHQLQAKLTVGAVDDPSEKEADSVAEQVMNTAANQAVAGPTSVTQREAVPEEEEEVQTKIQLDTDDEEIQAKIQRDTDDEEIQASSIGNQGGSVPEDLENRISSARGSGQPLADNVRGTMEQSMGSDFGSVRVHADSESSVLNRELGARAFTTGKDVFFGEGEYTPGSSEGQKLIAHELTHVVQQAGLSSMQRALSEDMRVQAKKDVIKVEQTGKTEISREGDETRSRISEITDGGNQFTQDLVFNKKQKTLQINLGVNWVKAGTWATDADFQSTVRKVKTAAYAYIDNKFKVVATPQVADPSLPTLDIPITSLIYDTDDGYSITLHGGLPGGGCSMGTNGGALYEKRTDGSDQVDITYAHEFGHCLLGLSDEYVNPARPLRVLSNDHSIMANYWNQGVDQAAFKVRHFDHILPEVATALAGYNCRIAQI